MHKKLENFPNYSIYSDGRVYSHLSDKFLKHHERTNGCYTRLLTDGKVSRKHVKIDMLVAKTFIPNPNNLKCKRHLDDDILNNNVNNLEWVDKYSRKKTPEGGIILSDFPNYVIYRDGRVYSRLASKYISFQSRGGYKYTKLIKTNAGTRRRVNISQHQLVSRAFIDNLDDLPIPNHKDGNGHNNDIDNLEWETQSGNMLHAHRTGLIKQYTRPVLQYTMDDEFVHRFDSLKEAGAAIGCPSDQIGKVCRKKGKSARGYKWKYETEVEKFNIKEGEEWKKIPGHSIYKISSFGRVYSRKTNRYLKVVDRKDGYVRVYIDEKSYYVHVLVAKAFFGDPPSFLKKPVVDHIDENKDNNNINNLEWIEFNENVARAHRSGTNSTCKPVIQYSIKGDYIADFYSVAEAARSVSVSHTSILNACNKVKSVNTIANCIWRYKNDPLKSEEHENIKTAKTRVEQYSLNGEKLATFKSINEASRETGANHAGISQTCRGKAKTAGGYAWCYEGNVPVIPKRAGSKKKVGQYDKKDNLIKVWDSINEASHELGIQNSHITAVCKGRRKTTGGFVWKYV